MPHFHTLIRSARWQRRVVIVAVLLISILSGCALLREHSPLPVAPLSYRGVATAESDAIDELLRRQRIIPRRLRIVGYQREKFGATWSTGHSPHGQWCTTRELVLDDQLTVHQRHGCTVTDAEGRDPYTGEALTLGEIDIDHIVPLSAAWDLGAWRWSRSRRIAFANDREHNLVITASAVNRAKSDATIGRWQPPHRGYRCWYALAYLEVIDYWGLALTDEDADALSQACRRWTFPSW